MSEQGGPYGPGGQPNPGGQGSQGWQQGPPPTGPQGWQQGQPPTGPQGWQQAPQPNGPQGWQQGPPPTGPQGWQQAPQPNGPQGWQQGPPPTQGFPAGQGQPWTGQQPAQPPPAKNRKPIIITAIAVVVALVAAAAVYFFAIRDSNTDRRDRIAARPQQSVGRAVQDARQLRPDRGRRPARSGRGSAVHRSEHRRDHRTQAARGAQPRGIGRLDDRHHHQGRRPDDAGPDETINDHVQIVKLTGGTVTVASDPNSIPLSDKFKRRVRLRDRRRHSRESQTVNIADAVAENDGEPIRVATVKRGDNWYVSLFYTIADNAVHAEGLPNPTQAAVHRRRGFGQPEEAAVDALIEARQHGRPQGRHRAAAARRDGRAARLRPADPGPVRRRRPDHRDVGSRRQGRRRHLDDVTDVTGGKKVSLESIDLTADGQTVSIERDADEGSLTVDAHRASRAITLNEDTIDTLPGRRDRLGRARPAGAGHHQARVQAADRPRRRDRSRSTGSGTSAPSGRSPTSSSRCSRAWSRATSTT